MHPHQSQTHNSITTTSIDEQHQDQDFDHGNNMSIDHDHDDSHDFDQDDGDNDKENRLNYETGPFYCTSNDPPESYSVCQTKVCDWLDRNTMMERNPSVKFACSRNIDPCQVTPLPRRSVSIDQRQKLSIIGFTKKPDGKCKNNDRVENVRLFRNRSEPGKDYCLLITEPVSPRVSCAGRIGSVRVVERRKKGGIWKSFKAALLNLVHTNRMTKVAG